jgi:hypothetical protein
VNGVRHPFTGAVYESDGDGFVTVTMGDRTGRFAADGRWLDGELREADPHMCGWVGGKRMVSSRVAGPERPVERADPEQGSQGPSGPSSERIPKRGSRSSARAGIEELG